MKEFKIGHSYYMRSIGDYDCIWTYKIIARTTSTITVRLIEKSEVRTCRINERVSKWLDAESVFPLGRYSMCPILSADHELSLQAEQSLV